MAYDLRLQAAIITAQTLLHMPGRCDQHLSVGESLLDAVKILLFHLTLPRGIPNLVYIVNRLHLYHKSYFTIFRHTNGYTIIQHFSISLTPCRYSLFKFTFNLRNRIPFIT
jgi:hypothetical protein